MQNLQTFEEFLNESLNEAVSQSEFEAAVKSGNVAGINPLDKGTVRKRISYKINSGSYIENSYGSAELKKLVEATLQILLQKYNDAIILGPKPAKGYVYEWAIEFQGKEFKEKQYIAFTPEKVIYSNKVEGNIYPETIKGGKFRMTESNEFGIKYQEMKKFIQTAGKMPNTYNTIGGDETFIGNWDRLLVHLPSIL